MQFSCRVGLLQIAQIQFSKATRQNVYGQEEAWTAAHPTAAVQGDATTRHDTMQMGMKIEGLSPRIKGGAIIDHETPDKRRFAAVPKETSLIELHPNIQARVCFMGHLGGVQGGSVCTREKGRAGGRHEHPAGVSGVRVGTEDDPEDAGVFGAAWV